MLQLLNQGAQVFNILHVKHLGHLYLQKVNELFRLRLNDAGFAKRNLAHAAVVFYKIVRAQKANAKFTSLRLINQLFST